MTCLRYDYAAEVDAATAELARYGKLETRLPLSTLPIPPETLTVDGSQWFHAVEATVGKTYTNQRVIRIRVITKDHRGVNVSIPCTEILYQKFRDLRFQIRNSDCVKIAFPELYVMGSPFHHELWLRAYDFKVQEPPVATPTVYI